MGNDFKRSISESLKLPSDLIMGDVNIRLSGRYQIFIENYRYIIEYSEGVVKIQCKNGRIKILGNRLCIEYFSKDEMLIKGVVNQLIYY